LQADVIVESSRPLPAIDQVGIVFNEEGADNYYVVFPNAVAENNRSRFRASPPIEFPIKLAESKVVNIWGVTVEGKGTLGSVYGSLDLIKAASPSVSLTDRRQVTVTPE
jgi:hypothetical protein